MLRRAEDTEEGSRLIEENKWDILTIVETIFCLIYLGSVWKKYLENQTLKEHIAGKIMGNQRIKYLKRLCEKMTEEGEVVILNDQKFFFLLVLTK